MTDDIKRAIAGAHEAEQQQRRVQEVAFAIQSMPPSEITELVGNLGLIIANAEQGATIHIHGPGNPRAYRINLPAQFVDGIHEAMHGGEQNGAVHDDEAEAT